ncbi:MAG: zinc ribbon domain-containing protein [Clostridia bacterium]|nr:zinc ribbon domain-containing protein [Clostridia bacterium]
MANFCPHCGSGLKAGATHCSSCGAGVCATNDTAYSQSSNTYVSVDTSDIVANAVGTLVAVTLVGGLTRQLYYHGGRYYHDPMCHRPFVGRIMGPHRTIHIHIGHHAPIGRMHPMGGGPRGPIGRPRPLGGGPRGPMGGPRPMGGGPHGGGPRGGGPRGGGHGHR